MDPATASRYPHLVPVLNERPVPKHFTEAPTPIPVRARIAWETGEEWTETVAVAWDNRVVLVKLQDRRWRTQGVWVVAGDVVRVDEE